MERGEIWLADLNPTRGSEQGGTRPVIIIFKNEIISQFSSTNIIVPLTSNLCRASLPSCLLISAGEGGLKLDSVASCHQLRVIDKTRLQRKLAILSSDIITVLEDKVLLTLGYQI